MRSRRLHVGRWLCVLLTAMLGTHAAGDEPSDERGILLPSKVSADVLIDLCAVELGVPIEYAPGGSGQRARAITLRSGRAYSPAELWVYLHEVLAQSGSTTVIGGGADPVYRVVPFGDAFDRSAVIGGDLPDPAPGYLVRRYGLDGIDPDDLEDRLAQVRPSQGLAVVPDPDGRTVLIGAVAARHAEIGVLVRELGRRAASVELGFVEVVHGDRDSVMAAARAQAEAGGFGRLEGLLTAGPGPGQIAVTGPRAELAVWRALIGQFDVPAGVVTRSYALPDHASDAVRALIEDTARDRTDRGSGEGWRYVESELTGSLIVSATPDEHGRIVEILDKLASLPPDVSDRTKTIVVRNRDAGDLRESLSRLLGVPVGVGQGESGNDPDGGLDRGARDDLVLAVDERLNAIVASGSASALRRVGELIGQLDVRQPQVLLEVILVSLSEGQSRDLGVELQAQFGTSGTLVGLGSLFGLSSVSPSSGSPEVGGTGGTAVILDPGDFSVVVRALDNVSDGRSVSSVQTLVNNNESATLSNTVQEPYATTVLDDGATQTGFGGSAPAGTNVSVSPQIASGGFLVLEYDVSLSAFLGEASSTGLPPPSQSTSISSIATIPDGHCIVVGGLELMNRSGTTAKTPLLGDIPVLGGLFRSDSRSDSRTRFYLFIRASVLRSPGFERLRYMSDLAAEEAEVDLGWPTVDPVIMR